MRAHRVLFAGALVAGCTGDVDDAPAAAASTTGEADAASTTGPSGTGAGLPTGTPHVAWIVRWGAKGTDEKITGVVALPDDEVVVTGTIGTFDVEDASLVSVDAEDIVLARFDAAGGLVASRTLGGPSQNGSRALARRADGTFAMLGVFGDTFAAFEPALETFGGPAVFVGAFDADFATLWGRAFVGAATGRGQLTMTTTDGGDVVVAGTFHDTLITEDDVVVATGPSDAYVARLTPDGELNWMVNLGGPEIEHLELGASTAVGDDVVIAGQLRGTLRTRAGSELAHSSDAVRAFLMRLDGRGAITAFRLLESTGSAAITRLVKRRGGLLAAMAHGGAIVTPAGDVVSAGEGDATLLWLDGAGAPLFGKTWGDARAQQIASLDVAPDDAIVAGGSFLGTIDFGDGFHRTDDGRPDGFAVRLSPGGVALETVVAGDVPPEEGHKTASQGTSGTAWLSDGGIVAGGSFSGTMQLGDAVAKSAGDLDAFVARLAPLP